MLSFIPTPIGNKEDITLRALRMLRELEIFFCEDTRVAQKLFSLYDIPLSWKKLYSFRSFTSDKQEAFYLELIQKNHCGLMSDAGTPGLSDPGKAFVKLCRDNNIPFEILPWATALVPAVVASPLDTTHFVYHGFLPQKKWRQTALKEIVQCVYPVYIYESVHRIEKLLQELETLHFAGSLLIARELSKMHEQYFVGSLQDTKDAVKNKTIPLKWEFIVWILPASKK